jgi:Rap1a immunity proteins
MRKLIVALCIASALISPAMATNTAGELAGMCEDGASQNVGFCAGYAEGLAETLQATGQTCPPKEATLEQALKVIKKYVADHPESHHLPGGLDGSAGSQGSLPMQGGSGSVGTMDERSIAGPAMSEYRARA